MFSKKSIIDKGVQQKKKFLYNNTFIAFVMRTLIKKFQGYPEDNASKLTWFEKLDFKVDLLTSLRSRDVRTKQNSLRNAALHKMNRFVLHAFVELLCFKNQNKPSLGPKKTKIHDKYGRNITLIFCCFSKSISTK